ncbi:hypothetical protein LCGC14_2281450, partial [marine sediment metagenome]
MKIKKYILGLLLVFLSLTFVPGSIEGAYRPNRALSPTSSGITIDADQVNIDDSGGIITATEVEGALQENRTAIDLNTIHKSSDGSDHTFIDQDVTSGSSPNFGNMTRSDDSWIGLGGAKCRSVLNDDTVDEFNLVDCFVQIGDGTFSWDHVSAAGDVGIEGKLEVDGIAYFDANTDHQGNYAVQLQNIPDLASKGAAYWFDGADDYIFVGDSDQLTMVTAGEDNAFSIVVLAQFNATSGNYSIFGKYNGAAASEYEFLVSSNLLYVNALESDAGDKVGRSAPFTSTTRNWLAAVYTGSETSSGFSLYLNGNEISTADDESGTYTGMSNTNANVMIGRRDNNTLPFNGQISR